MTQKLAPVLVGLAMAALVTGLSQSEPGGWIQATAIAATAVTAIAGGLWLFGLWRGQTWASGSGLAAYTAAATAGLLQGGGTGWLLLGLALALAAWDLEAFGRRIGSVQRVEDQAVLERRHLLRLSAVEAGGLCLAAVALEARLELGFGLLLLLGLLAIAGLSRVMAALRQENH